MIKYNEDYYIDADNNCFILKQDVHKVDKDGKELYKVLGYYGSLNATIKGLIKVLVRNNVKDNDYYNLKSALDMVDMCVAEAEEKIDNYIRG